jgi:lipopolysaccharide transport system ATP-binding protein
MHDTLGGAIADFVRRPIKNLQRLRRLSRFQENGHDPEDIIWALKEVSFEVKQGEVVGIIGRNGAGKSTLLKILSKITEPTSGRAEIHGRVSSLLEVGTGFHPELTGRENVYLNGTVLGMTRAEIDRKFDQIVDFSGVEKFIDTPVKRYSSGMKVRLAFSVAAHLEPENLLVDEVLAVGDAAFQKKCLGKMDDVAKQGRTVIFVSHNMAAVEALCERVIILEVGQIVFAGETREGLEFYLFQDAAKKTSVNLRTHPGRRTGMYPVISGMRIINTEGIETSCFRLGKDIIFEVAIDPGENFYPCGVLSIGLYNHYGQLVCMMKSNIQSFDTWRINQPGVIRCVLRNLRLIPGGYTVGVAFFNHRTVIDCVDQVTSIEVIVADVYGTGQTGRLAGGFIVPEVIWEGDHRFKMNYDHHAEAA